MSNEIWKPVVGYEGFYEVSNLGNIRSMNRRVRFVDKLGREQWRIVPGRMMHPTVSKRTGRVSVMLTNKAGERKRISLHRIVGLAFVDGYDPLYKYEINHIDENPLNNAASNLEWCDRKYNMNYGTLPMRINKKNKRPVEALKDGVVVASYDSVRAGKKDGYDGAGITYSIKGIRKYKGLDWRYKVVNQ